MPTARTIALSLTLALLLSGCATGRPGQGGGSDASTPPPGPLVRTPAAAVSFRLYEAAAPSLPPEVAHELAFGDQATIPLTAVRLDILMPGTPQSVARQAVRVEGAALADAPVWIGGQEFLAVRLSPGKAGDKVTVQVQGPGLPAGSITLLRSAQATVTVDQRYGDEWVPVTVLKSTAPAGPAQLRMSFSRPVRRQEVEKALTSTQSLPVRGLMTWIDDRTLIWQIQTLPPRLDFLLGSAHDEQGLLLPGGIPSLRGGEPPVLVTIDPRHVEEQTVAQVPPDVATAFLVPGGGSVNLKAWRPGATRWDWQAVDFTVDMATGELRSGWSESVQPRNIADLEDWVVSPAGTAVGGLASSPAPSSTPPESAMPEAALVITDLPGGRRATYPDFVRRYWAQNEAPKSVSLAWSADGQQVAALSYKGVTSDLVALDLPSGQRRVLMPDLPIRANGTTLTWAPGGRYLLAGYLLVDLKFGTVKPLEGTWWSSGGAWSPDGSLLAFSPEPWGRLFLVDPATAAARPAGTGLLVGWTPEGRLCFIRWSASDSRHIPAGI